MTRLKKTGNPATSKRLRAVEKLISRKRGATSLEIAYATGSMSPHSDVSRLRTFHADSSSPWVVLKAQYMYTTVNGYRVNRFRMVRK